MRHLTSIHKKVQSPIQSRKNAPEKEEKRGFGRPDLWPDREEAGWPKIKGIPRSSRRLMGGLKKREESPSVLEVIQTSGRMVATC